MKRGLALCGGGSKGSYEMGVWKALKELGISIDIVCGSSIGALNAVMYAQDKYDDCLELWQTTTNNSILTTPISIDNSPLKESFKNMNDLIPFVRGFIRDKGADITPFKETLDKYVDIDKVINSKLEIGVVCAHFPSLKPKFVNLKQVKKEEIKSYILASASCFPLFPLCKIGKETYIDGGYYDNLPIDFCLDLGATEVIAVDLNYNITHKEYLNKPFVKYIHPSWDLGGFFNFSNDTTSVNLTLGYNDCLKAYGIYTGFRYTFYANPNIKKSPNKFLLLLSNIMKDFKWSKIRPLYKEDTSLFKILEKYTYNKNLTALEYYIRALEELMEYLGFDNLKVYRFEEVKSLILKKINGFKIKEPNLFSLYENQKTQIKKREYLNKSNKKDILGLSYNIITHGKFLDKSFVLNLYAVNPNLVIYLVLAMTWSDIDVEEEKNFGFTFEFED